MYVNGSIIAPSSIITGPSLESKYVLFFSIIVAFFDTHICLLSEYDFIFLFFLLNCLY